MERYLLKDDIWWVGAIDWDVRDFHGYETPRGTTYNAYLVLDEKVALVDGCREGFGPEVLARVRGCCGLRPVDYLVVNHVEPDHSGAIPWLVEQTRSRADLLLEESQGCSRPLLRGGDGGRLGHPGSGHWRRGLRSVAIPCSSSRRPCCTGRTACSPMSSRQRPSYRTTRFGQHLATSKRFADEVEMSVVMEEASKYYANILMPFGGQIQKMLAKIGELGLEIEAIGPSHGVIWRRPEDVARIVTAYEAWSDFQAPARVSLIYDTMWHSTEQMTMAIEDGVAQEGVDCVVARLSRNPRSELARMVLESRAFLVGTPTLNNTMFPTVGEFLTYIKGLRPRKRISGAYGSCGWAGGAVKQVDAELRAMGLDVAEPIEVKYRPSEAELDACVALGRQVARQVKAVGE